MSRTGLDLGLALADRLAGRWVVDGQLRQAPGILPVESPEGGRTLSAGDVGRAEAVRAADVAAAAQEGWGSTGLSERVALVERLGARLRERRDDLVELIVLESGKTRRYAGFEVDYALLTLDALCSAASGLAEEHLVDGPTGRRVAVERRPVGPALLVTPWNFPLSLGLRKAVSGLLAGCVVILKPSELTPFSSVAIGEALIEAGAPAGVVAVLPTSDSVGVVAELLAHPAIRKLSFTGSTAVGRELARKAADALVRASLELGGNAPLVIAPSADPQRAVAVTMAAKFGNSGQACTAANRVYVPRERSEELTGLLVDAVAALEVGDPREEGTAVGPLISAAAASRLSAVVDRAREAGAVVVEHPAPAFDARSVRPAVVSGVSTEDEIAQAELFGPVLTVIPYDGLEDAVAQANATPFGLAAYVVGEDEEEVSLLASRLRSGMIAVNSGSVSASVSPFGGVGWSGQGRENGRWGIEEFTDAVAVLR